MDLCDAQFNLRREIRFNQNIHQNIIALSMLYLGSVKSFGQ